MKNFNTIPIGKFLSDRPMFEITDLTSPDDRNIFDEPGRIHSLSYDLELRKPVHILEPPSQVMHANTTLEVRIVVGGDSRLHIKMREVLMNSNTSESIFHLKIREKKAYTEEIFKCFLVNMEQNSEQNQFIMTDLFYRVTQVYKSLEDAAPDIMQMKIENSTGGNK